MICTQPVCYEFGLLTVPTLLLIGQKDSTAIGKDLGTEFEQTIVSDIQQLVELEPTLTATSEFQRLLAHAVLVSPSWTIRGGTNEILRGIIAKGLK